MRLFFVGGIIVAGAAVLSAQDLTLRARQLKAEGDTAGARALLEKTAQGQASIEALTAYAEFLDQHGDAAARPAYEKLYAALGRSGDNAKRAAIARRLILLDLLAGDSAAAARHRDDYRSSGGGDLILPVMTKQEPTGNSTIEIPGPLRSFARMAALSPDLMPEDLLGALARNVVTNGYQAASSSEALDQTEYLKLIVRYLSQARELSKLAIDKQAIHIETCESPQTADLLRALGYRMRGGCGSEVVLETVNATRAFLTIDSGFPLAELELALRTNRPFHYAYAPTRVPLLYGADYWLAVKEKQNGEFIDVFLSDPSMCRLYLGISKLDAETSEDLRKNIPVQRLRAFSHVLDFFGAMMQIRGGKAVIPGGAKTTAAWTKLVGVSPDNGSAFFEKLIAKDDGWLASYFDSLSRISGPVQDYLTDPERMDRFYSALRGKITSPGPARPVFRSNTDLMLLTTRLRLEANGKPHIPGSLEVWKNLFIHHPHGKYDGKLTKAATGWKEPDDVIEALFALCRKAVENEPLKIFMAMSDINRHREKPLEPATVDRLAREYRLYGAQYPIFAEVPTLSDKTIMQFIDTAQGVMQIKDQALRADVAGMEQALIGIWQIFCRQESILPENADASLSVILTPFGKLRGERELFDAGRAGVAALLKDTKSPDDASPQDRLIDLLAGTGSPKDSEAHRQVVQDMIRIFETQRLISLKTLFDLSDHLDSLTKGEKLNTALVNRLATRIADIQLPRAALTGVEKNALSFGYWTERHIEAQRKVNVRAAVERAANDPEKLKDVRAQLAPFLRDTLVGLNYVHFAPPGAQILVTNPVFVRSHDFLGLQGSSQTWRQTEVFGTGWPSSGGGRLVGSLVGLPYALAEAEQNFLIPSREQALIWGDLVPQMIVSAKVPRWWNVTPNQLHWVGLHMRYAETLLAEAAIDERRRQQVAEILERQEPPARAHKVIALLQRGQLPPALELVTPAEMFALAGSMVAVDKTSSGVMVDEIRRLAADAPKQNSYVAISHAFGTPKPTLTHSYRSELLNLRTFPTLMGYSSRIMAESWESNLLYYAALADEVNMSPSQLNIVIPEWTQKTVERIFATHLEDWPALLRSLRLVGDDIRGKTAQNSAERRAALE